MSADWKSLISIRNIFSGCSPFKVLWNADYLVIQRYIKVTFSLLLSYYFPKNYLKHVTWNGHSIGQATCSLWQCTGRHWKLFFPNTNYTDVYMYTETPKFYLHYAYIRTLTTKKPCEKYVFCVKRKKKTKLKIRRIPEINIS